MNTTIQKWGNSLAVRLPKGVLESTDFREGKIVKVKADGKRIIITPVIPETKRVDLSELVRDICPQNRHKETDWGKVEGNEVW